MIVILDFAVPIFFGAFVWKDSIWFHLHTLGFGKSELDLKNQAGKERSSGVERKTALQQIPTIYRESLGNMENLYSNKLETGMKNSRN